jgi:hypothetical protein
MGVETPSGDGALRAEHDLLARRLEVRPSVDVARRGLVRVFGGLLALGVSGSLAWNRWGYVPDAPQEAGRSGGPLVLAGILACAALAVALLAAGGAALRRSRRLAREEAVLFERLRSLRRALGFDP